MNDLTRQHFKRLARQAADYHVQYGPQTGALLLAQAPVYARAFLQVVYREELRKRGAESR